VHQLLAHRRTGILSESQPVLADEPHRFSGLLEPLAFVVTEPPSVNYSFSRRALRCSCFPDRHSTEKKAGLSWPAPTEYMCKSSAIPS
jgi:hypothetical protein